MEVDAEKLYLIVGGEDYEAIYSHGRRETYNKKANCIIIVKGYGLQPKDWAYASRLEEEHSRRGIYPLTEELFIALTLNFPPLDGQKVLDFEARRVAVAKFLKEWSNNGS